MGATCLQIIQNAASWLQLPIPPAVWSSTDIQVIQLRTLLNKEGDALRAWPDHNWNKLVKETSFATLAANLQPTMPTDFDHICNQTIWNRTMNRMVWGPMDEQEWQQELAGPTFTSPYYAYRIRGGQMLLTPVPAAGNNIYYEYVSSYWVYAVGGTTPTKSAMTADDDFCVFQDSLVTMGLRWRYLRSNGLDFSQEFSEWTEMLTTTLARDGGAARLSLTEKYPWRRRTPFIPSGGWNV
jgi:hypothetical protein